MKRYLGFCPYQQYDPAGLERKVREQWGERVFFDT